MPSNAHSMKRRALVTGAAAGLAAGCAIALARDGFDCVAITYRSTPPDETCAAIRAAGAQAPTLRVDFLDSEESIEASLAAFINENGPFDTLVHAVGPLVVKRFARSTMQEYRAMFDGNVRSAVLAARAVLPAMRSANFGRIILFGANGAGATQPFRGLTLYQAAKSAVIAFARTLALEEAEHGITVNAIEPGDIRDKRITRKEALTRAGASQRGRIGSFEDIADVVRFLAARERDFISGAVIAVNGGSMHSDERNAREE